MLAVFERSQPREIRWRGSSPIRWIGPRICSKGDVRLEAPDLSVTRWIARVGGGDDPTDRQIGRLSTRSGRQISAARIDGPVGLQLTSDLPSGRFDQWPRNARWRWPSAIAEAGHARIRSRPIRPHRGI